MSQGLHGEVAQVATMHKAAQQQLKKAMHQLTASKQLAADIKLIGAEIEHRLAETEEELQQHADIVRCLCW
jgi:hypothetical protein